MMFSNFDGMFRFWMFGMFFLILMAVFVANDAQQFGENGFLWALVVVFMPMMGLIIYLVVRSTWTRSTSNTSATVTRSPPRREVVTPVASTQTSNTSEQGPTKVQFCTSCGLKNSLSASYCNSCGELIQSQA